MKKLIAYIKEHSRPLEAKPTGEDFRRMDMRETPPGFPKALLFDIYGTLFISASGDISLAEEQQGRADPLKDLVRQLGLSVDIDSLPQHFIEAVKGEHQRLREKGIPYPEVRVEELWARILGLDPAEDREKIEAFALAYEMELNPVYPMPELEECLRGIRERGIPMGIVSNAQFFTPLLFDGFLGKAAEDLGFQGDLCAFSFDHRRAKPDTFLYETLAAGLAARGIRPEESLYVGNDLLNDISPAKEVGFFTALFAGDRRSLRWREDDPRCRGVKPHWVLKSLGNLLEIIRY